MLFWPLAKFLEPWYHVSYVQLCLNWEQVSKQNLHIGFKKDFSDEAESYVFYNTVCIGN